MRAGSRRRTVAATLAVQLLAVLVAGACGRTGLDADAGIEPEAAACGLESCAGCCDPSGNCVAGTTTAACGSGGVACGTCGATEECAAGLCLECGPTTCSGCCSAGHCEPGTTQELCGDKGTLCEACPTASTCGAGSCLAGEIVLFGGEGSGALLSDTWTYDGVSWTQSSATGPSARDGHVMASAGSSVMMFGGKGPEVALSDTWTFDGKSWTQSTATGPTARYQHGAATLFAQAVVFGGRNDGVGDAGTAGLLDDTWTFDGTSWTPVSGGPSPAARSGYAMGQVTGTLGANVFLFGGVGVSGPLKDVWRFNGVWSTLSAIGPSARVSQAMAVLGAQLVLFGGYDPVAGTSLGDTWVFNGQNWTTVAVEGPPARYGHAMATLHDHVVLFGGVDTGTPFNDTWTFDGTAWTKLEVAAPPARSGHAMATVP